MLYIVFNPSNNQSRYCEFRREFIFTLYLNTRKKKKGGFTNSSQNTSKVTLTRYSCDVFVKGRWVSPHPPHFYFTFFTIARISKLDRKSMRTGTSYTSSRASENNSGRIEGHDLLNQPVVRGKTLTVLQTTETWRFRTWRRNCLQLLYKMRRLYKGSFQLPVRH